MQHSGLLPVTLAESDVKTRRQSVDASLWLFEAARELVERTGTEDEFVKKQLYPALRRTFVRFMSKTRSLAWVTAEGLLAASDAALPLTGWTRAPRASSSRRDGGCRSSFKRSGAAAARRSRAWPEGSATRDRDAAEAASQKRAPRSGRISGAKKPSFLTTALAKSGRGRAHGRMRRCGRTPSWRWPSIRVCSSAGKSSRRAARAPRAAHAARLAQLVAERSGLPWASRGNLDEREGSYHQGTVWPYLIGFYARAALRLKPDDFELREELIDLLQSAAEEGLVLCHVAQLADGEEPHAFRGCPAQA